MTITEMNIEVRQSAQNIATNKKRLLLDDEIDWLLNKIQQRFIQSKIKARKDGSGGFEVDQLDTDAVRTILKTKPLTINTIDNLEYICELPDDYAYLISDDSKTFLLCGLTPATITTNENILKVLFPESVASMAPYYATLSLTIDTTTVTLATILSSYQVSGYTGLSSATEKWIILAALLWYLRNVLNITVYWEKYLGIYAPQTLIFPGKLAGSITIDTTATTGVLVTTSYSAPADISGSQFYANRLTNNIKLSTILKTAFYKPSSQSPLSTLQGNKLFVYSDSSFIVSGVSVDYIKKARRMSLLLNQDCELPEEFHQTICDLTVEYFKGMIADPNWEVKLKDNMTRNPSAT